MQKTSIATPTSTRITKIKQPVDKRVELLEETLQNKFHETWKEYLHYKDKLISKCSRKSVHNLRTSIRKIISALDLFYSILDCPKFKKLSMILEKELKGLGPLRDVQVQLNKISHEDPPVLNTKNFCQFLKRREAQEFKKVLKYFNSKGYEHKKLFFKIDRDLNRNLTIVSNPKRIKILFDLMENLDRSQRTIERKIFSLDKDDAKSFHSLRISLKDFCYKIEMINSFLDTPKETKRQIDALKKYLGRLQDQTKFLKYSKRFLRKSQRHPHPKLEIKRQIERKKQFLIRRHEASILN